MKNILCGFRRSKICAIPFRRVPAVGSITWKEPVYSPEAYGDVLDCVFIEARKWCENDKTGVRTHVGRSIERHGFTIHPNHVDMICSALDDLNPGNYLATQADM